MRDFLQNRRSDTILSYENLGNKNQSEEEEENKNQREEIQLCDVT